MNVHYYCFYCTSGSSIEIRRLWGGGDGEEGDCSFLWAGVTIDNCQDLGRSCTPLSPGTVAAAQGWRSLARPRPGVTLGLKAAGRAQRPAPAYFPRIRVGSRSRRRAPPTSRPPSAACGARSPCCSDPKCLRTLSSRVSRALSPPGPPARPRSCALWQTPSPNRLLPPRATFPKGVRAPWAQRTQRPGRRSYLL